MYSKYERRTDTRTYEDSRSCTKAAGRLSEPSTCKLCGRRSTMSGRRGPRPSCPSGSASAQARRPVNPTPPRMTTRAVPMSQLRLKRKKKRKRRRRKRRRNKCFLKFLLLHHFFFPPSPAHPHLSHKHSILFYTLCSAFFLYCDFGTIQ